MNGKRVLITGATGILGSWLLAEALRRGYVPTAHLRGASEDEARRRIAASLESAGADPAAAQQVTLWLGDNTQPGLGLPSRAWEEVRAEFSLVLHSAALTSFSRKKADLIWDTNAGGVARLLSELRGGTVPVYHVSTAYVAGAPGEALAMEHALKAEEHCRNPYEVSKRAAELNLRQAFASGELAGAVFRPSIIAGAASGGRISQFMNIYQMLRLVDMIESGALPLSERVRVMADPEANLNIVPVDWTASALWDLVEREGASGKTYHLANPLPPTMQTLSEWAKSRLNQHGAEIVFLASLDPADLSPTEQYIHSLSSMFLQYISRSEPRFDRTNTDAGLDGSAPFPAVDGAYFDTLLDYARARQWESAFARVPA